MCNNRPTPSNLCQLLGRVPNKESYLINCIRHSLQTKSSQTCAAYQHPLIQFVVFSSVNQVSFQIFIYSCIASAILRERGSWRQTYSGTWIACWRIDSEGWKYESKTHKNIWILVQCSSVNIALVKYLNLLFYPRCPKLMVYFLTHREYELKTFHAPQ